MKQKVDYNSVAGHLLWFITCQFDMHRHLGSKYYLRIILATHDDIMGELLNTQVQAQARKSPINPYAKHTQ